MNERMKTALRNAIASRGRHKGLLKAKCPPMGTDEAAMWQAVTAVANPYKMGIGHLILMNREQRAFYEECQSWADENAALLRTMDRDRNALAAWGVW